MQDSGHILFDNHGCGSKQRAILDEQIKSGERSFRDVSEEMWGSLNVPFEDGFAVMEKTLDIDPDFRDFHKFCIQNDIPFHVISAGLKPILRRVLDAFLGEEEVRPAKMCRCSSMVANISSSLLALRSLRMMRTSQRMAHNGRRSGDMIQNSDMIKHCLSTNIAQAQRKTRQTTRFL